MRYVSGTKTVELDNLYALINGEEVYNPSIGFKEDAKDKLNSIYWECLSGQAVFKLCDCTSQDVLKFMTDMLEYSYDDAERLRRYCYEVNLSHNKYFPDTLYKVEKGTLYLLADLIEIKQKELNSLIAYAKMG